MAKRVSLFSLFFIIALFVSCSDNKSTGLVFILDGPEVINAGSTALYAISVVGDESATYNWMVDPSTAGNFDNPHKQEVKFTARYLPPDKDLAVTIGVIITCRDGVVYKSIKITIKYIPENTGPQPTNDRPPTALAHADVVTIEQGDTVNFFDDSTDPDGNSDIVTWAWDFSYMHTDGFIVESSDRNPAHAFYNPGTFLVKLWVTDKAGLSDYLDEPIEIHVIAPGNPPLALAHAQSTVADEGDWILFIDESIEPDEHSEIVHWEWDFSYDESEGFQVESTEQNPKHQFLTGGDFLVMLRVTDTRGMTDILDEPIAIHIKTSNTPPVAAAHALSTVINEGEYVQFMDDSTDADGQSDIVQWEWDFSYNETDGFQVESTERNPFAQYPTGGQYKAHLRVTDQSGASDILDNPIWISVYPFTGWSHTWGNVNFGVSAERVAIDSEGSVYVKGLTNKQVDLDPGPGEYYLPDVSSDIIIYISKFDRNGNWQWSIHIESDEFQEYISDLYSGNFPGIFYYGYKLSEHHGNFYYIYDAFIRYVSPDGQDSERYYATGSYYQHDEYDGYVYESESFEIEALTVDPELNIYFLLMDDTASGYTDEQEPQDSYVYGHIKRHIVKYSTSDSKVWEVPIPDDYPYSNDRYQVDFMSNGNILYSSNNNLGVVDQDGEFTWNLFLPRRFDYVTCDAENNIYFSGIVGWEADLDPGSDVFLTPSGNSMYLCKLDSSGNFEWGAIWPNIDENHHEITRLYANSSGNVYMTGYFLNSLDYDPGPNASIHTVIDPDARDAFLIVLDFSGAYKWGAQFTTWDADVTELIRFNCVADSEGFVYGCGTFRRYVDIDPGPGINLHNASDTYSGNVFLTRINPENTW